MALSDNEVGAWWANNAGASEAQVASWMQSNGVGAGQLGGVIGYDSGAIQQKYDAAVSQPEPYANSDAAFDKYGTSDANVVSWLTQNKGASDAETHAAMDRFGVGVGQLSRVTGIDQSTLQQRYDAATPSSFLTGAMDNWAYDTAGGSTDSWLKRASGVAMGNGYYPTTMARQTGGASASANPVTGGYGGTRGGSSGVGGSSGFSTGGAPSLGFNLSNVSGPSQWDVSGNQTVANQLTALMASDNPLIQQARARAMQQSNARGLSNSSIAQTAADAAAYDAMMQVAKQDAGTYASAAQSNTAAQNQFTSDANAFLRNGYMADYNLSANEWAAQQAYARDREAQREQNAFNLAAMERENELNKGNTTSANAQSDKQGYINALNNSRASWSDKYAGVMADPNMSPENKKDALKSLAASYNTQIKAYTGLLGWDYASWDIEYTVDEPAAAANKPVDTTTTTNYP